MIAVADTVDHPPSHHYRSQSLIQFSQSDKFFSKLLSKESDPIGKARNPSFRVYYGGSTGSVPFHWEKTPGTPKHALFMDGDDVEADRSRSVVPPLTPPPSFFNKGSGSGSVRSGSRKLLEGFFMRRIKSGKAHVSHLNYSSSSSSCNSASSESSSDVDRKAPRRLRSWRSLSAVRFSMRFGIRGELQQAKKSPSKTTSFGGCLSS